MVHLRRYTSEGYCYHVTSATNGRLPEFRNDASAKTLIEAMQFIRADRSLLLAYVVMPDHFHMLIRPQPGCRLSKIVQSVKGYSSRIINQRNGRRGPLWQQSFYDRVIRDEEQLLQCIQYIQLNPVKARLSPEPDRYRWSSAYPGAITDIDEFFGGSRRG